MAGVTAAGASVAACSGAKRNAEVLSSTTSSDTSRSIGLPYLFDGDPQAQQSARRLLSAATSVENLHTHEQFMRLAIDVSNGNPTYPFGAVVVDHETGDVLAQGVNRNAENPVLHGEIVAINDYVTRHGNARWNRTTLYSTGEPCVMCCGALTWARIPRVVWASSIATIRKSGISGIDISAIETAARAYALYQPELFLGGVLAEEMDKRFATRVR
jgi:tRNA(Arg) A34 adenosine deaminase TadA